MADGDVGVGERRFREYVRERQTALRRTAYLLCGDWHQADDLVQTTLTKLFLHWRRASRADNLDAYSHTVLVRVYIDERRRGWWRVRLGGRLPERQGRSDDPEIRLALQQALGQLAPRQRAAVVLRFYQDLSVEQVAEVLGCRPGTVKSQTSRALATLQKILVDNQVVLDACRGAAQ